MCDILLFEKIHLTTSDCVKTFNVISELETSLSSPNKAVSTDKSTKDNSKVNSQLRSRIKVQDYIAD